MADLKDFVSRVPEYSGWNHAEKIKFFAWFLHTLEAKPYVNGADIAVCYSTLHDEQPSSIAPFLSNMEKKTPKEAIKESRGYSLVKKVRDELDATYLKRRTTVMVEKLLADLPGKIPDHAERVFGRGAHLLSQQRVSSCDCHDVEPHRLSHVPACDSPQAG